MSDYVIVTDSSCDLPASLVEELELQVTPLAFIMGDKTYWNYPDNREMSPEEFYSRLANGEMATTNAVNAADYETVFRREAERYDAVIHINIGMGFSCCHQNAKLADVADRVRFQVADVKDFAPQPQSIVLTNPPYGERLGDLKMAGELAQVLGRRYKEHPCQGLYAITADGEFEQHFGQKAAKRRKMYNGMIPCQIYMYYNKK